MKLNANPSKILFEKKWPDLLAGLLHVLLFILGGLMLARWTWLFLAPDSVELPPKTEQANTMQLTTLLDAHWFTPTSGRVVTAPPPVNFKLVGIYAPLNGRHGFAVFNLVNGKQRAVLLHQEITTGINLLAIGPNGVQVGEEGNLQTLSLESNSLINTQPLKSDVISK